jgi:hypothetical protein
MKELATLIVLNQSPTGMKTDLQELSIDAHELIRNVH